jgi:hypothetical protein
MDIQRINEVIGRANAVLEAGERDALNRALDEEDGYEAASGTEAPDYTPEGDPDTGGEGGVANAETPEDNFYSFLLSMTETLTAQYGITEDDAVGYIEALAGEMADAGELPAMPDPESGIADEFSAWAGAAMTAGFQQRVAEYAAADLGL